MRMAENQFNICGLTFEAVRYHKPIPHWKLKIPNGEILDAGCIGRHCYKSKPKLKAGLEYLLERFGEERFLQSFE